MWGGINSKQIEGFKYTKTDKTKNRINLYATPLMKSNGPTEDHKLLTTDCFYIPNMLEQSNDRTIFDKLVAEIKEHGCEIVSWSKHFKYENPEFLPTLTEVVNRMAKHFGVKVCQTRLNYYPDNTSWKPFHKDSHKYVNGIKENFTMGASFGYTRELELKHESSGKTFKFPQNNGDCFAFTSQVNNLFLHGVPKVHTSVLPRFSIIAWGKLG